MKVSTCQLITLVTLLTTGLTKPLTQMTKKSQEDENLRKNEKSNSDEK